ncbi:hypothetical protein M9H77_11873 [Catharanthus roseus]|uniref:Uncharacterized protein n=1 Tax=Catharanthus roseus TaxID=4058 RepID=A0ACC0BFQ9_CATRO|nr:hypothetical protein M9H77_11873 [Catharanthus roseus]
MVDLQGYVFLFLVCVISTILVKSLFRAKSVSRLPPSPRRGLPIIGHLHLLAPIPHQALNELSRQYGGLIHLYLGSVPCVVASSAETAKEFLKIHENSFSNRPQTAAVNFLTYGSQDFSFAPYGPYWKFMKKLCMSELLGGRTLELLLPVRHDEIKCFIDFLMQKAKTGEEVNIGAELITLTNNIISRMLMSTRCSQNKDEAGNVRELIQEIAELTGKFNLSDYVWFCKNLDLQRLKKRVRDVHERFDQMMERIIENHQETRQGNNKQLQNDRDQGVKDLLDILLNISEDESSEIRLTRENIKAFLLDIFAAGTDTSAITVEWALAEIINHPSILKKAVEEIDSIVGKTRIVEESDISKLPYLQAIVKETLRLHPTGPLIVRESTEDCIIGGYNIPAKTRLFVNVWAIGRDPNHWENPLEFHPERFLCEEGSGKSQMDVRGQHFQFLPFGSGRRGCPGTSLALQVVQTSLAAMIQCFEWKLSGNQENGKVDMEEGPGITLPRANPLVCVPVARLNPCRSTELCKNRTVSRLPPSPRAIPLIGHLHLLAPIPHQALHKLSKTYGSLIHLYLGSVPCVVASSPETAKELLKTHDASFSNRPSTAAVDFLSYGSQDFSFAPYGPYWKFMKKLCVSELLGGRTLDLLLPVRREEIKYFVEFLLQKANASEEVNIGAELIRMTNNVVSRMLMSTRCSGNRDKAGDMRKLIRETADLAGTFNLSDYLWFCKNLDLQGLKKRLRDVLNREAKDENCVLFLTNEAG